MSQLCMEEREWENGKAMTRFSILDVTTASDVLGRMLTVNRHSGRMVQATNQGCTGIFFRIACFDCTSSSELVSASQTLGFHGFKES